MHAHVCICVCTCVRVCVVCVCVQGRCPSVPCARVGSAVAICISGHVWDLAAAAGARRGQGVFFSTPAFTYGCGFDAESGGV